MHKPRHTPGRFTFAELANDGQTFQDSGVLRRVTLRHIVNLF